MIRNVCLCATGGGHLFIRRLQFLHARCQSVLFSDADEPDSCSSLPAPRCQQGNVHTQTLQHVMLNHAHFTEYINQLRSSQKLYTLIGDFTVQRYTYIHYEMVNMQPRHDTHTHTSTHNVRNTPVVNLLTDVRKVQNLDVHCVQVSLLTPQTKIEKYLTSLWA